MVFTFLLSMRMKSNKRGFRPESVALDDMLPEESRYTANPTSSSSSGTTSPRREFTSPLHMSGEGQWEQGITVLIIIVKYCTCLVNSCPNSEP